MRLTVHIGSAMENSFSVVEESNFKHACKLDVVMKGNPHMLQGTTFIPATLQVLEPKDPANANNVGEVLKLWPNKDLVQIKSFLRI